MCLEINSHQNIDPVLSKSLNNENNLRATRNVTDLYAKMFITGNINWGVGEVGRTTQKNSIF